MQYDKRAVKILLDTYWSSKGWKSANHHGWVPDTPPDDLGFAMGAGLMFLPRKISHQEAIQHVVLLRSKILPRAVGAAFVAGLPTNQLATRSAMGSLAVALNMPLHPLTVGKNGLSCSICGAYEAKRELDLNVLNFERHKWGGVRHTDPVYIAFDLERFLAEPYEMPTPGAWEILHTILEAVRAMPGGARLSDLVRVIKQIVPGNEAQRRTIIEILGYSGILRIPEYPGFFRSFTPSANRQYTQWNKDDWGYPTRWWRGGNGIDSEAMAFWFGR